MSRREHRRRRGLARRDVDAAGRVPEPEWVLVGDRRMFVVGETSGGIPFGVYEDEMESDSPDDRAEAEAEEANEVHLGAVLAVAHRARWRQEAGVQG